jgi:hypothetical protein
MGFRAYHSHILRSLSSWREQGVDLQTAHGGQLHFDVLHQDDLWGFLGKKDEQPTGPKRKIQANKLAVLDAYFRIKDPALADSFAEANLGSALVTMLKSFFATSQSHFSRSRKQFERLEGIYLPKFQLSLESMAEAIKAEHTEPFCVSPIFIRRHMSMDYIVVHKIAAPVRPEDLPDEPEQQELRRHLADHSPAATCIYSGVGLVGTESNLKYMSLACMLRDTVTYDPHLMHLDIILVLDEFDETWDRDPEYVPRNAAEWRGSCFLNEYILQSRAEL